MSNVATVDEPQQEENHKKKRFMDIIDAMDGREFEFFCAELLRECGYNGIHVTRASGDQGVDIIAYKNGTRCAFQCKRYSEKVGNEAVQQVNAGQNIYSCFRAVVITNNYFTRSAKQLAKATHVELWDRDILHDKVCRVIKAERAFKQICANAEEEMRKAGKEGAGDKPGAF